MVSIVKRASLPIVSGKVKVIALAIGPQVNGATPAAPAKPAAVSEPHTIASSCGAGLGSTSVTVIPNGEKISRTPATTSAHAASPNGYSFSEIEPITMLD